MPSFILTAIDDDGTNTTKEFKSEGLKEVVEKTSDFLKGVGYVFDDLHIQFSNNKKIIYLNLFHMLRMYR